jgi:Ca2+/Na+ antiporter
MSKPSRLPLLIGILLIMAAPVILVVYFVNMAKESRWQSEATGVVTGKEKQDTAYYLQVFVKDGPRDYSTGETETPTDMEDELKKMLDSIEHSGTYIRSEESVRETPPDEKELYTNALKRKEESEKEEMEVVTDSETPPDEYKEGSTTLVSVDRTDFDKYKAGDTVSVVYSAFDYSTATLNKVDKEKKKKDAMNMFIIAGAMVIFGIILVVRTRSRRAQEQQLDTLNSFPTSYSTVKKTDHTTTGTNKGPGGGPGRPF